MATHNRAALLEETLGHLSRQKISGGAVQIVIADNGSSDSTPGLLAKWKETSRIEVVLEPTPGKNRALNRALSACRGELLVFTDDDIIPASNWLQNLSDAADRWPGDSVFGGPIIPRFPPEAPDFVRQSDFRFAKAAFVWFAPSLGEGPMKYLPSGGNLMIRRQIFDHYTYSETIGPAGHEYPMGSETELLRRLEHVGHRRIYVPGASVEHVIRPEQVTLPWLLGRAYRYGRGAVRLRDFSAHARVRGVPRWIWKKWAIALGAYLLGRLGNQKHRWTTAMDWWRIRGSVAEFRAALHRGTSPGGETELSPVTNGDPLIGTGNVQEATES